MIAGMKKTISHLNLEKAAYSVSELLSLLPIGRTTLNEAIKSGELKSKKLGKKRIILVSAIIEYLESMDE